MNLETELRTAMAEHVRVVAAAPGLLDGVHRRHRRRKVRNRALTGAVIATAAVATIPFLGAAGSGSEPETGPPPGQKALAPLSPAPTEEEAPSSENLQGGPSEERLCPLDSRPPVARKDQGKKQKGFVPTPLGPQRISIEGVEVGYLPAHIADRSSEETADQPSTKSWGYGMTWSDAKSDGDANATHVGVMVLCGPEARGAGLLDGLVGWGKDAKPVSINGKTGRREQGHAAWLVRPGVAVNVQVSKNVDLNKVIAGIKLTG